MDQNNVKNHFATLRRNLMRPFTRERRHTISFKNAWNGIVFAFKTQPNFRFHTGMGIFVVAAGLYFHIRNIEWIIIAFTIMTVLVAETINTAIEQTIDLLTDKYHLNAKNAKDVAAGMVLISAVFAVIVGLVIFVPYIQTLLGSRY
jgi:diacylglycerol kinase